MFKASPYYLGKKLVELDLDLLKITQISNLSSDLPVSLSQIPFFPLPVFERYGTEAKNFSSLVWFPNTSSFIQAFQNPTFGVKNTAVAQKLSKLASCHLFSRDFFFLSFPVFERYDTEFKKPEKTPIFMPLLTKIS